MKNWKEIQEYYNQNHSWRETMKVFPFAWATLQTAIKLGLVTSRTRHEGLSLRAKLHPREKHTQATKNKLSKIRIKHLKEHPDQVPYLLNHYSKKTSYPETYFLELIEKEQLPLKHHLQVSLYQLDFYNQEKMFYLEIDGEQHHVDKRVVASDIKRTAYLTSLGWTGYRIRWSEYQKKSYEEKAKVITEIKNFLY